MKSKQFKVALKSWMTSIFLCTLSPVPLNLWLTHTLWSRHTDLILYQCCSLLFSPEISGPFLYRQIQLLAL